MTIKEIYAPIERELSLVQERLKIKEEDSECLSSILSYIHSSHGKLIRPALFLFTTRLDGTDSINLASSIELIHSASLLHDDVIDASFIRRGKETIVRKWGKDWALLVGDLFLAKAFEILVDYGDVRIIKLFTEGCLSMCRGQMSELENGLNINEETYLKIIYHKTAHLFELSCKAGAIVGNNDVEGSSNYGRNLGMAFQIIDDCLDVEKDIESRKMGFPIIKAIKMVDTNEKRLIKEGNVKEIKDIIKKYKGEEQSRDVAKTYIEKAKVIVKNLSLAHAHRSPLLSLCDFVLNQTKP